MPRYVNGRVTEHLLASGRYTFTKISEGRVEVTHDFSKVAHPARQTPSVEESRFTAAMTALGGSWNAKRAVCAVTNGFLYIESRYLFVLY